MNDLLRLAEDVARAAGALLLERFRAPAEGVTSKSSSTDMVSDADRAAEALIVDAVRRARPDDGILGEEGGESYGTSGIRWVVDPLDGTTNFLFGIPQWAVSIACEDEQGAGVGVVYAPVAGELFAAARGAGARCNGRPIAVRGTTQLTQALVATGFGYAAEARARQARELVPVLPAVRDIRRLGAASLDLAWVACGRFDAYFESPMERWDVAAGRLLVTEAGGRVADIPFSGDGVGTLAAAPGVFDALAGLVGG